MRRETKQNTACHGNNQFRRLPLWYDKCACQFLSSHGFHRLQSKMALVYVDDVVNFSKDFCTHVRNLDMVFQCHRKEQLKLAPSKCKFGCRRVLYFGHVITRAEIEINPEKDSCSGFISNSHNTKRAMKLPGPLQLL